MKTSKKLIFCLSISDSRGIRVTQMCSHFVGYEIKQDSSFSLNFNIEKLNFQPGLYCFNTYLEGDGEPMDWIINAFDLVVEQGDFYGSGMVLREGQGNTLIPFSVK